MDKSKQRAAKFLEKEIKTYTALSLFFSKGGVSERADAEHLPLSPSFYEERIREATKLASELQESDSEDIL